MIRAVQISSIFLACLLFPLYLCRAQNVQTLPGTRPLTIQGPIDVLLMDGAHRFVENQIKQSVEKRNAFWQRDLSSTQAYEKSVQLNRKRLARILGVVDQRIQPELERFAQENDPLVIARTELYNVYQVRWSVLPGVHGEGLLVEPHSSPKAIVVAIPDADHTPEQLLGLEPGISPKSQFARRLAESGCRVLVPVLINRSLHGQENPQLARTQQSHREWIYRQAFHMGRHIIGYEIQRILATIDWARKHSPHQPVGVAGYGEGGLLAFYSAALDTRIKTTLVCGYFSPRENLWSEPIYRNVWGFLREFGNAEVASLIAPRALIIEHCPFPRVRNQKGDIQTPDFTAVEFEFRRIDQLVPGHFQPRILLRSSAFGSEAALKAFLQQLVDIPLSSPAPPARDLRKNFDPESRHHRLVAELEQHVQRLVRKAERVRNDFFLYKLMPEFADTSWTRDLRLPAYNPARFIRGLDYYRHYLAREVIGEFDQPLLPPNPRTRLIYDRPKWRGWEVVLDVYPDLIAWGILLVPKDLQPGERRPVVVCQHGRNGLPQDTIEGNHPAYRNFAARLANRGFVVFAPHNLYRGEDRYRWLDRKANSIKASLFSFIVAQHRQILNWLKSLPFVDPARIGFYGLSYGGETAMRVPAILTDYALSICSGDFNNWTRKVASTREPWSFMYTIEWEMPYFNMGNTFDYAELAYLIFPRPFMVERGHHDRVGRDPWVAFEYAKVRWLYAQFNLSDRTEIEYFNGGHTINGQGTFRFLHRHLKWPEP